MKYLLVVIILGLSQLSQAYAKETAIIDNPYNPNISWSTSLSDMYEKVVNELKKIIKNNFEIIQNSLLKLLSSLAVLWILFVGFRGFIKGSPILSDSTIKMSLFLVLSSLLNFKYFDMYVVKNLESLFEGLPQMFSSIDSNNLINTILNTSSQAIQDILSIIASSSLISMIDNIIIGGLSIASILSLCIIVILNAILNTLKFYVVLSLGGIFILLAFFNFTRKYSIGAIQVVLGAIFNMLLLSVFLNIYNQIFINILKTSKSADFISNAMIVIVMNICAIYFIKALSEISSTIVGSSISSVQSNLLSLRRFF